MAEEIEDIVLGKSNKQAKKMYFFAYSAWDKDDCTAMMNKLLEEKYISFWRTDMYNSFYILSDKKIEKIRDRVHKYCDTLRFLILEMTVVSGYIPQDTWSAIDKYCKNGSKDNKHCAHIVAEEKEQGEVEI